MTRHRPTLPPGLAVERVARRSTISRRVARRRGRPAWRVTARSDLAVERERGSDHPRLAPFGVARKETTDLASSLLRLRRSFESPPTPVLLSNARARRRVRSCGSCGGRSTDGARRRRRARACSRRSAALSARSNGSTERRSGFAWSVACLRSPIVCVEVRRMAPAHAVFGARGASRRGRANDGRDVERRRDPRRDASREATIDVAA